MFLERLIYNLKRYTESVFVCFVFIIRSFALDRTDTVHVCYNLIKNNWYNISFGKYKRSLWSLFIEIYENLKRNWSFVLAFLLFILWFKKNWISSSSNDRSFIDDCISQCVYPFGFNTLHNMFGVSFQNDSQ